jgi:opacity protein-like surface antigen
VKNDTRVRIRKIPEPVHAVIAADGFGFEYETLRPVFDAGQIFRRVFAVMYFGPLIPFCVLAPLRSRVPRQGNGRRWTNLPAHRFGIQREEVCMRWPLLVVTLLTTIFAAGGAQANDFRSRAKSWDFTVQMRGVSEQSFGTGGGTTVDVNSDIGFGFGFGYNFNDNLGLELDIGWASPSYHATIATDTGTAQQNGEMSTSSIQLNLFYNFLKGPITPFVSAGIGSTYIDTNIPSGPPGASCWWDPWYGYTCYGYQPTYSDYRFSYTGSVGVRWDLSQQIFLRAAIGSLWIDMPQGGDQSFTNGRVEVGFSYY